LGERTKAKNRTGFRRIETTVGGVGLLRYLRRLCPKRTTSQGAGNLNRNPEKKKGKGRLGLGQDRREAENHDGRVVRNRLSEKKSVKGLPTVLFEAL